MKFSSKYMVPALLVVVAFSSLSAEEPVPESSYTLRRNMLQAHQLAGMATWLLWLSTNLEGERALRTMYRRSDEIARVQLIQSPQMDPLYALALRTPGKNSITAAYFLSLNPSRNMPLYLAMTTHDEWEVRRAGDLHRNLAYATIGMYALTASLAFFSPPGPQRESEPGIGPTDIHKAMIPFHLLAMLALPTLGKKIEEGGPDAARRMQNVGWGGFGALSVAFFSMAF